MNKCLCCICMTRTEIVLGCAGLNPHSHSFFLQLSSCNNLCSYAISLDLLKFFPSQNYIAIFDNVIILPCFFYASFSVVRCSVGVNLNKYIHIYLISSAHSEQIKLLVTISINTLKKSMSILSIRNHNVIKCNC